MKRRTVLCILGTISLLYLLCSCSDYRVHISEGKSHLRRGEFDEAMEEFQKAALTNSEKPELLAATGLVLSLKRISLPRALQMMERSLEMEPDEEIRWELIRIYLDMKRYDWAARLIGPEKIPLERFFSPELDVLRAGIHCLQNPIAKNIKQLEELDSSDRGDYLLGRCYLNAGEVDRAFAFLEKMGKGVAGCEFLVAWDEEKFPKGDPGYRLRLEECRRNYPGSIALHRETPPDLSSLVGTKPRRLFPDEQELPPYVQPDDFWMYYNFEEPPAGSIRLQGE